MQVKCPRCGNTLMALDGARAAQGKCPHCGAVVDVAKAERVGLNPGDVVGGFRADALIGRGGMAAVYRGTQLSLGRPVAIKALSPKFAQQRQAVERFHREATVLAQLSHPNIVSVLAVGSREDDGLHYIVMELVDGESLKARLERAGRLPFEEAARLLDAVAAGVEHAHGQGVLHRDIKPGNILITREGVPKIVDFGIARLVGADEVARQRLTLARTQMGSAHYMAPEQMKDAASVDHRADVYALGVVLYEALTGELPIGQFTPASRAAPGVPTAVDRIVRLALAPKPEDRFQSVAEFRTMLQRAAMAGGAPTRAAEPGPVPAAPEPAPRRELPLPLVAGGIALVIVAFVAAVLLLRGGCKTEQAGVPPGKSPEPAKKAQLTEAQKREEQASDLLAAAERNIGRNRPLNAARSLDLLERDYADTAFLKAHRADVERLRQEIKALLGKGPRPEPPPTKKETGH